MSGGVPPQWPGQIPLWAAGKEPLPPGFTEEDRAALAQNKQMENYMSEAMFSCPVKTVMAGTMGFGMGAFFSLMSASMAIEDPIMRDQVAGQTMPQKASTIFKELGKNMVSSGKGFAKVGALFAGIECCIEGYRGKNDIYNSVAGGFVAGGVLARNAGPRAALGGGLAFAAFSAVIDLAFIRREPAEED